MLKYLHIENIAVIESSDIEFSEGFNVLTGETGAGKSIVIDAINAVLGERTSKDLIRAGCDSASVSALFGQLDDDTVKALTEYDLSPDEDGNLLITRKLSLNGKGIIKINGKPFTASVLKAIAGGLINIHGQHDNQALLNPDTHSGYIDALAENQKEKAEYYKEFKNVNKIRKELEALECDEDEKQRKTELLKYQIKELTEADIKIGEIAELKEKLTIAENYEKTVKALSNANNCFYGGDDTDGAVEMLKNAEKQLSTLNGEIEKSNTKLRDAISVLEDVAAETARTLEHYEFSDFNP
ncbi:MAG: AAA family ATPase, partial [Acutalibacteraceae bacterium]|nr:AAA family ATPase [Acutalibacteraceae bacterium]